MKIEKFNEEVFSYILFMFFKKDSKSLKNWENQGSDNGKK